MVLTFPVSRHFQAMKQTRHPPMIGVQSLLCVPGYSPPTPARASVYSFLFEASTDTFTVEVR